MENSINNGNQFYLLRMNTKIYIIEIMIDNETDEIIEKLFESHLQRYQKDLEEKMRGSEFVFDSVDLLYDNLYKISLNRGRSYIDSLKWLKNKKVTINHALTAPLNYQNIKNNPERISKISLLLINKTGKK